MFSEANDAHAESATSLRQCRENLISMIIILIVIII